MTWNKAMAVGKWLELAGIAAGGMLVCGLAWAQNVVVTQPGPSTTANSNVSTTIAVTNTFQQVFAALPPTPGSPQRRGCTIQNKGTNNMYVTEGLSLANSTITKAALIAANGIYTCNWAEAVLYGQINITGTSGDTFYAAQY